MKKKVFKGFVNGKEFTKKEDFDKAVNEAVKSGDDLVVSSRYEEVDTPKKKSLELTDTDAETLDKFIKNIEKLNSYYDKLFNNPFNNIEKFLGSKKLLPFL